MPQFTPSFSSHFRNIMRIRLLSKSHILKYISLFSILGFIGIGTVYIQAQTSHTSTALKHFSNRSDELLNALQAIERQRINLDSRLSNQERELSEQLIYNEQFLMTLTERIWSLESTLGIEHNDHSLSERIEQVSVHALLRTKMLQVIPNGSPIQHYEKSSGYGSRTHPVTGAKRFHLGLDLTATIGTPVFATANGVVEQIRPSNKGYGNLLKVSHSYGFMTLYAHLDRFNVSAGQFVKKGELIAWSGNTGLSTGPHLHYEVRFLGRALNPNHFIKWSMKNFNELFSREKQIKWSELIHVIEESIAPNSHMQSIVVPDGVE